MQRIRRGNLIRCEGKEDHSDHEFCGAKDAKQAEPRCFAGNGAAAGFYRNKNCRPADGKKKKAGRENAGEDRAWRRLVFFMFFSLLPF